MKSVLNRVKGKEFRNLEKLWYCFEDALYFNRDVSEMGETKYFMQSTNIGEDMVTFFFEGRETVPKLYNIRYVERTGTGERTHWLRDNEQQDKVLNEGL